MCSRLTVKGCIGVHVHTDFSSPLILTGCYAGYGI